MRIKEEEKKTTFIKTIGVINFNANCHLSSLSTKHGLQTRYIWIMPISSIYQRAQKCLPSFAHSCTICENKILIAQLTCGRFIKKEMPRKINK